MFSEELFKELAYPFNELYRKHGFEVIQDICELAAGDFLYVPSIRHLTRKKISRDIVRDYDSGMSFRELQKKYRITNGTVKRIVYKTKKLENKKVSGGRGKEPAE